MNLKEIRTVTSEPLLQDSNKNFDDLLYVFVRDEIKYTFHRDASDLAQLSAAWVVLTLARTRLLEITDDLQRRINEIKAKEPWCE